VLGQGPVPGGVSVHTRVQRQGRYVAAPVASVPRRPFCACSCACAPSRLPSSTLYDESSYSSNTLRRCSFVIVSLLAPLLAPFQPTESGLSRRGLHSDSGLRPRVAYRLRTTRTLHPYTKLHNSHIHASYNTEMQRTRAAA
jgi:hypothetical protein